jgi:acetyltransferase-like isoleucine patch superfamily enzyme
MHAYRKNFQGNSVVGLRIGSSTFIDCPEYLKLANHVYIGHFNFIEASHGVNIHAGCQITSYVTITTHSSHDRIRLEGSAYGKLSDGIAKHSGPIEIGEYTFIGPNSVVMPNTRIGKGCIVQAHAYVQGDFPDFSIIGGSPAKVIGSVESRDTVFLEANPALNSTYMK